MGVDYPVPSFYHHTVNEDHVQSNTCVLTHLALHVSVYYHAINEDRA